MPASSGRAPQPPEDRHDLALGASDRYRLGARPGHPAPPPDQQQHVPPNKEGNPGACGTPDIRPDNRPPSYPGPKI